VFEAVARHSGAHRAARELNTVQSNVTMRIRRLEAELGMALFERHTKGMSLTQAGQRLLPHAVEIQNALRKAKRAVVEEGNPAGPLVFGTLQSISALHLTGVLSSYLSAYPDVDVSLHTGTTLGLLEKVLSGGLEGAFVYGPLDHPQLFTEIICEDELVVFSGKSITDLGALSKTNSRMIVLRSGWNCKRLESILATYGVIGLRVLELGTLEAVLDCVSAGLGVTVLPEGILKHASQRENFRIHRVARPMEKVQTLFIRRRDGFVSSALLSFLNNVCASENPFAHTEAQI